MINFSASRCASFAFGHVVDIDSCVKSEVTRFRNRACRCAEERPRCRYFNRAPAILTGVQGVWNYMWRAEDVDNCAFVIRI